MPPKIIVVAAMLKINIFLLRTGFCFIAKKMNPAKNKRAMPRIAINRSWPLKLPAHPARRYLPLNEIPAIMASGNILRALKYAAQ